MADSGIIWFLAVLAFAILVAFVSNAKQKAKKEREKSPQAMMNRATGQASRPNLELQQHDQQFAKTWACEIFEAADRVVIIDTETTGIKENDEILQIAAIDGNGNTLIDTLVNPPTRQRWTRAQSIHGITPKMVREAPSFEDIYPELKSLLGSDRIKIFYNARFDAKMIAQTTSNAGLPPILAELECAMIQYSLFRGEWDDYHQHYKWHKLPGANHNALADCHATLNLIKEMAGANQ